MDDDFDEIEALDCSVLEEIGKEDGAISNSGCLGTVIILVGLISAMTFGITKLLTI